MGAVVERESVDVEAHVDLGGQRPDDAAALGVPRLAAELRSGQREVVERGDTLRRSGHRGLRLAEIAHGDLSDPADLRHVAQDVEHDRRMGKFKTLVSVAQVAVGVDMQDAERFVTGPQGADQPVGRRMVAAHEPHDLARVEPAGGLCLDIGVHGHTALVHAADLAHDIVVFETSASFEVVDHPRGVDTQPLRGLLQRIVHVGRGDAAAPGPGSQRVVKIQLRRGFDDGIGSIGRSGSVGDRHVPRRRNQHQFRRFGLERKPEIGSVVHADAIRIEGFLFHNEI